MKLVRKPAIKLAPASEASTKSWKVLLIDDDPDIIRVTRLSLKRFMFSGKSLEILEANSFIEAKTLLHQHNDIAAMMIDVVMENDNDGLHLVKYIREDMGNNMSRLIICTGQPGLAPERYVIDNYDIDDYLSKTNLTSQNLYSKMRLAIRGYEVLLRLKHHRDGLKKIVDETPKIYRLGRESKKLLLEGVLDQLHSFCSLSSGQDGFKMDGFVAFCNKEDTQITYTKGRFRPIPENSRQLTDLSQLCRLSLDNSEAGRDLSADQVVIPIKNESLIVAFIYIETGVALAQSERALIEVFAGHCSSILENINLYEDLDQTYQQSINTLAEIAEFKDDDTAMHLNRIAGYTQLLATELGLPPKEAKEWGQASRLHDVGKLGIPDSILQKPGKLTEDEFEIMRTHTTIGGAIVGRMHRMGVAKDIALGHHEHWNGNGYPKGLKGDRIPLAARVVALVDVFDALVNKRCYKEEWSIQHAIDYLHVNKEKQFDPSIVDAFDRLHAQGKIEKLIKDSHALGIGLD
tara:strand:+ start:950 stop:2503 length:1554 start_codon:yes stop_codon:yes gene_type:complete